jgi:hypothetical protein
MNTHQHVLPTTTITISNVSILRTQAMNPSICHTTIPFNYQTTWSQHVTPIAPGKTSLLPVSTYPMWYNVIPPFVPLDPSLYLAYQIGTKGLDSSIFRNCIGYIPGMCTQHLNNLLYHQHIYHTLLEISFLQWLRMINKDI